MPSLPPNPPSEKEAPDDRLIWDTWLAAHRLPALSVADEIGLFAALENAPATAAEAADRLAIGRRASEALLGLLAALGFLERRAGRYHLTPMARRYLLPDSKWYWGGMLHTARDLTLTHAFVKETLIKDRRPDQERSTDAWKSGVLDAARALRLTRAMHAHSLPAAEGLARSGLLGDCERLLDVGGGSGCFAIALAVASPRLRAAVMELEEVGRLTSDYINEAGVQERVSVHIADMFRDRWPSGHDVVFFSNIFHDWDEARCRELARKSFAALPSGGRIALHEMLLDEGRGSPLTTAAFSMHMMLFTEGKQFTFAELSALLQECGFRSPEAAPAYGYYSLVTARKP